MVDETGEYSLYLKHGYSSAAFTVCVTFLKHDTNNYYSYIEDKSDKNWTCSAQARARWFLALTLARNPQLAPERKAVIPACTQPVQVVYVKHGDVKIEVGPYKVLQDK